MSFNAETAEMDAEFAKANCSITIISQADSLSKIQLFDLTRFPTYNFLASSFISSKI